MENSYVGTSPFEKYFQKEKVLPMIKNVVHTHCFMELLMSGNLYSIFYKQGFAYLGMIIW